MSADDEWSGKLRSDIGILVIHLILLFSVVCVSGAVNPEVSIPQNLFPDTPIGIDFQAEDPVNTSLSTGNVTGTDLLITPLSTIWIRQGDDIFLGEQDLDVANALGPSRQIAWWPGGGDPDGTDPDTVIRVTSMQTFDVDPIVFGNRTGAWYRWEEENQGIAFYIRDPAIDLRITDTTSGSDITDGQAIAGDILNFCIDTNLYPIAGRVNYNPNYDGPFRIDLRYEDGESFESLWGKDGILYSLHDLTVQSQPWYFIGTRDGHTVPPSDNGWDTGATYGVPLYKTGRYAARAECNNNDMLEEYRTPDGSVYVGKTVSPMRFFSMAADPLTVNVSPSSVIPGEKVLVRLSGVPDTTYYLWMKKTRPMSGLEGDQPPFIIMPQAGLLQDPIQGPYSIGSYRYDGGLGLTIRDDVPFRPDNGIGYYATVTTDSIGERTFSLSTSRATAQRNYQVHAERLTGVGYTTADADLSVAKGTVTIHADGDGSYYLGEKVRLSGMNAASPVTYLFIAGGNLPVSGGRLPDPYIPVRNGVPESFITVTVLSDKTWEYLWNTAYTKLPKGRYTLYAVSDPADRMNLADTSYGQILVVIEGGEMTARADRDVIALGEELILTGTNMESGTTYLYLKGENLVGNGVMLSDPSIPAISGDPATFTTVPVDIDETWQYTWKTGSLFLAPGLYSIYAASGPYAYDMLDAGAYATVPVALSEREGVRLTTGTNEVPVGSPFSVTVHAEPYEEFYLWLWRTGSMSGASGDQPPLMQYGQSNVFQDPEGGPYLIGEYQYNGGGYGTIRSDVPPGPYEGVRYYARVVTDNEGLCELRFQTSEATKEETYEIYAEKMKEGAVVSDTLPVTVKREGDFLSLYPGWNLVSIPAILAEGHNTASIFSEVPTAGHSLWRYDPDDPYGFIPVKNSDPIVLLDGYWIYTSYETTVPLIYEQDTGATGSKYLLSGWNLIGSGSIEPVPASTALSSVQDAWSTCIGFSGSGQRYDTAILKGGTGEFSDSRLLSPGQGYWLFMSHPGTLQAVG